MSATARSILTPNDDAFWQAARGVWSSREDLQSAYPNPDSDGFAQWLAANAVLEYPNEFAPYYPPPPPADLVRSSSCGASAQVHLWSGTEDILLLKDLMEMYPAPKAEIRQVLDFGCGCGRVARHALRGLGGTQLFGADVSQGDVDWCTANLPGTFVRCGTQPPLPFETNQFDLIYVISVFSHLEEQTARAWMAELSRICAPGGTILISTVSSFALLVISRSPEHQELYRLTSKEAFERARELEEKRFVHYSPGADWVGAVPGVDVTYGHTFLTPDYVASEWAQWVRVRGYVPAALFRFQDLYALTNRGD